MKSLVSTFRSWIEVGKSIAIARVVSTWGSAPRRPGAVLGISSDGDLVGSVSGGCIEGAVREKALGILDGAPPEIVEYGVDDESAWAVGLSCGGSVRVLIQLFPEPATILMDSIERGERVVLATTILGIKAFNLMIRPGEEPLGEWPVDTGGVVKAVGTAGPKEVEIDGVRCFLQAFLPPERLIIVGGSDIAVHLIGFAHTLGFDTILIDPRAVFSDRSRFPVLPSRIETKWPQEVIPDLGVDARTYAVLLTHDPKIDDPAVDLLLKAPAAYIGALGGRKTRDKRRERMREAGFSAADIKRIHGPAGIRIGAATPAEIAVSIMAEIVAVRNGRAD